MSHWIQTRSGQAFDLLDPDPHTVRLDDIAVALSRCVRFAGHTTWAAWSVAGHSLLCESLLPDAAGPELRLLTLLHDAHEAYTGDWTTPIKAAIRALGDGRRDPLAVLQSRIQDAIHAAFGWRAFPVSGAYRQAIRLADLQALGIEKAQLMSAQPREWGVVFPQCDYTRKLTSLPSRAVDFGCRARGLIAAAGMKPLESLELR